MESPGVIAAEGKITSRCAVTLGVNPGGVCAEASARSSERIPIANIVENITLQNRSGTTSHCDLKASWAFIHHKVSRRP